MIRQITDPTHSNSCVVLYSIEQPSAFYLSIPFTYEHQVFQFFYYNKHVPCESLHPSSAYGEEFLSQQTRNNVARSQTIIISVYQLWQLTSKVAQFPRPLARHERGTVNSSHCRTLKFLSICKTMKRSFIFSVFTCTSLIELIIFLCLWTIHFFLLRIASSYPFLISWFNFSLTDWKNSTYILSTNFSPTYMLPVSSQSLLVFQLCLCGLLSTQNLFLYRMWHGCLIFSLKGLLSQHN